MAPAEKARDAYVKEVVYVAFKRKWFILTIFLFIFLGVCAGAIMAPRTYEASAILMMKRGRGELVVTPGQGGGVITTATRVNVDQEVLSEAELLRRRSLLQDVVLQVGTDVVLAGNLDDDDEEAAKPATPPEEISDTLRFALTVVDTVKSATRTVFDVPGRLMRIVTVKPPPPKEERAIQRLSSGLRVAPLENSNLIKVSFEGRDPRFVATVLDLLLTRYVEQYAENRTPPGAVGLFERQVQNFGHALKQAEDALQRLQNPEGITAARSQRDLYVKAALDRETALQLTRSEIEELREKGRMLREQLQDLPDRVRRSEEIRRNPVVDNMRSRLVDLEMERNKLLQKFTEQDRRVQDIEREIGLLRERALSEPPRELAGETYSDNPTRTSALADLVNTEAQLIRSTVKVRNLERDMDDFYSRVRRIDGSESERLRQERRVKMLEDAYILYAKKYEEARISAAMDENRIVNVALVEPVNVTSQDAPGGRGIGQLAFMGAVVGMVAGVGGAFLRESFSGSFTTDESVRRHLGLPVLGSISSRRN